MRPQIWIIGAAFVIFGAVAWAFHVWSPAYAGLIILGSIAIGIGAFFFK